MKIPWKIMTVLALAPAMAAACAQQSPAATPAAGNGYAARETAGTPSIESQIEALRRMVASQQAQIDQLRRQLAERDGAPGQRAAQASGGAQAQAAAVSGPEQAEQQTGPKTDSAAEIAAVRRQQAKMQQAIENPDAIHYKGITLSPSGSFLAAETVYRSQATGAGLNTPFGGIPLPGQAQAHYSEFYGSGRQSRIAMLAEGKLPNTVLSGYYEADFLSAGITSNNNQSNSYTLRQRQLWAQARLTDGWAFTGGQMWSLVTETTKGLQNRSEILPSTIDPQYTAGFVWARQYGFRVTKDFGKKFFAGVSVENPQTASVAGHNLPANFVIGQPGTGGGLYNPTANYASNPEPDFIAKIALEPGLGHYEIFGIGRFFRARVYPNALGGDAPIATGAYNDSKVGGGIGGSLRVPTLHKHLDMGIKGMWGDGVGRYGSTGLPDMTVTPGGEPALLHGFSALATLELHATRRLDVYFNYGGDYVGRHYGVSPASGKVVGYGAPSFVNTGCAAEPVPGPGGYSPGPLANCAGDTKDVQEIVAGYWFDFYKGSKGRIRQGIQYSHFERNVWSGVGGAPRGTDNGLWTSFRYYLP